MPPRSGSSASTAKVHSWDLYGPTAPGYAPPTVGGGDLRWDEEEEASDAERDLSPAEAGERFAALLLKLRYQGQLSSRTVCVLADLASRAGACGPCRGFAMKAGGQSGNYQRKIDAHIKLAEDPPFYHLQMPGFDPVEAQRTVLRLEVLPPHELVAEEVSKNPGLLDRVRRRAHEQEWAQAYSEHPAVLSAPAGATVLPLALYVDGVPFTKKDSFIGIWVYNLLSMERKLAVVLRKSELCSCGCRKYCSLFEVFRFLRWSFEALATGRYPEGRHDSRPWDDEDAERIGLAGKPLPRGAVVLLKGDWAEFCLTFGFSTWSSAATPCLFCTATRESLYETEGLSMLSFPHTLKGRAEYEAACARAEKKVVLTREQHAMILPHLSYDKRRDR